MEEEGRARTGQLVTVYVLLLALLAVSLALASTNFGILSSVGILGTVVLQVGLIMSIFMGLRWSSPLVRVIALGGVFFLSFLVVLIIADYLTRGLA
jgi:caa(3)-type oxidase subunit IV